MRRRNPAAGSIRNDAYVMIRNALAIAHRSKGNTYAKQAALSYAQGVLEACAKLGAITPADKKLYMEALREIQLGGAGR